MLSCHGASFQRGTVASVVTKHALDLSCPTAHETTHPEQYKQPLQPAPAAQASASHRDDRLQVAVARA